MDSSYSVVTEQLSSDIQPGSSSRKRSLDPDTTVNSSTVTSRGLNTSTASGGQSRISDQDADEDSSEGHENIYMSVYHGGGKLGAAFYDPCTSVLYVVSDVMDQGPEFSILKTLFTQLGPQHLIVSNRQNSEFRLVVWQLCGLPPTSADNDESSSQVQSRDNSSSHGLETSSELGTSTEDQTRTISSTQSKNELGTTELHQLPAKQFGYPTCMRRVLNLRLPSESESSSETEHQVFMSGLIDFNLECVVRAAGALLHFLDEFGIGVTNLDDDGNGIGSGGGTIVLSILPFVPKDVVGVEDTTLAALQVFNTAWMPAASRVGSWNQQREGLSLFNILNRCKSVNGVKHLRYLCRTLPRDLTVIEKRQRTVAYFAQPINMDTVKALQDCLRNIKSLNRILKKLMSNQASVRDWKCLKSTLLHMKLLIEICVRQVSVMDDKVEILEKLALKSNSTDLRRIINLIEKVFDVEASEDKNRFSVLSGVDDDLDKKRRLQNGLPDLLYQVVQREIEDLPSFMIECAMIYVPHIGYLLAIQPWWNQDQQPPDVDNFEGLKFMFFTSGIPHFKSKRCSELDQNLGDTATDIAELETGMMIKLSNIILATTELLLDIGRLSSELDALLSLSIVAMERDWTRPNLFDKFPPHPIYISAGRHPLQELSTNSFVANSTCMGDRIDERAGDGKMVILTGPNACGKSVYLKQVGLIVYLAHLGSFVPAESADIPLISSIHSRIQTLDSLELGLSAFAVDLNQMSSALRGSNESSLVLVDEFGKGTSQSDGIALLAASVEHWILRGIRCPFVIVSTHFQSIKGLLPADNPVLTYKTFTHEIHGSDLVHHYRLVDGVGISSQALHVAAQAGLKKQTLKRALKVLRSVAEGKPIPIPKSIYPMEQYLEISGQFLDLDFQAQDFESKFYAIIEQINNLPN